MMFDQLTREEKKGTKLQQGSCRSEGYVYVRDLLSFDSSWLPWEIKLYGMALCRKRRHLQIPGAAAVQ